jgi:translation elongation factor EF-1alpha
MTISYGILMLGYNDSGKKSLLQRLYNHADSTNEENRSFNVKGKRYFIQRELRQHLAHTYVLNDIGMIIIGQYDLETYHEISNHLKTMKSLFLEKIIIVLNKMDTFSLLKSDIQLDEKYSEIVKDITLVLNKYDLSNVSFVPISCKKDFNIGKRGFDWYTGETILEMLQNVSTQYHKYMPVSATVIHSSHNAPTFYNYRVKWKPLVRVNTGRLYPGEYIVMPSEQTITIQSIQPVNPMDRTDTIPKDVYGIDISNQLSVTNGDFICDKLRPILPTRKLLVEFYYNEYLKCNLVEGDKHSITINNSSTIFTLSRIVRIEKDGKPTNRRMIMHGDFVRAIITLNQPICCEKFSICPSLGRFIMNLTSLVYGRILGLIVSISRLLSYNIDKSEYNREQITMQISKPRNDYIRVLNSLIWILLSPKHTLY